MAKEGSKIIAVAGLGDKRQLTAVFGATMAGSLLPVQIIYASRIPRCLPNTKFPHDWIITFMENHWANERTTEQYIKMLLVPYIEKARRNLSLAPDHPALVILERSMHSKKNLCLLEDNHIRFAVVLANCTDRLQPLNVKL